MKKVLKNGLTYAVTYSIIFYFLNLILAKNNIEFMNWIYYLSYCIIILSAVMGTFQLLLKIKSKIKRNLFVGINAVIVVFITYGTVYFIKTTYSPQYIINKDNTKIVASIQSFHHTYINYYKYINYFMKGKKNIDSEYYSRGAFNPFETDSNYTKLLENK